MTTQTVQWKGDNTIEVERLLANHLARADREGDRLKVVGLGVNIELKSGDSLLLQDDRLGVRRGHDLTLRAKETWVTWQGNNLDKVESFLSQYKVRLGVTGTRLALFGDDHVVPWFVLEQGDRIVKRNGEIIISKLGRDHRA